MTNSEHFPADPWGLPIEEADETASAETPTDEAPAAAPADTEPAAEAEPDTETHQTAPSEPEAEAEPDTEAHQAEPPEPEAEAEPDTETHQATPSEPEAEAESELRDEVGELEAQEETPTSSAGEPIPSFLAEPEPEPVSQSHAAARGVLDALGISGNDEDLPEEPPEWMVAEPDVAPPTAYESLGDLASPEPDDSSDEDLSETGELEDLIEGAIDAIEEPLAEPLPDIENLPTEDLPTEDLIEGAIDAIEEPLAEPLPGDDELDLGRESIPELDEEVPDLEEIHEVIEALEPTGLPEEPAVDLAAAPDLEEIQDVIETLKPGDEPNVDETVAQAVAAAGVFADTPESAEPSAAETQVPAGASDEAPVESPDVAWGTSWRDAAQGWVQQADGTSTWRPIVTTTFDVGLWDVDTFLGVVAGDAVVPALDAEHELPAARARAMRSMLDDALARGAHAVVGVRIDVQEVGTTAIVSAVGTAVTLRNA